MSYTRQLALPASEPVSLADAKVFLKLPAAVGSEDALITGLIQSAREQAEISTGRCLAQRQFLMVLDSFPFYTDTIQSQLAYPPSYYSLPRYSTTLWNYSQMIKVPMPPLKSIDQLRYIDTNGNPQILDADTGFVVDRTTEYARIFPIPGQFWPPCLYTPNAVQILFTAGYDPNPGASLDTHLAGATITAIQISGNILLVVAQNNFQVGQQVTFAGVGTAAFLNGQTLTVATASGSQFTASFSHADYANAPDTGTAEPNPEDQQPDSKILFAVPQSIRTAILMLVAHWHSNREPVSAGAAVDIPNHLNQLLWNNAVVDFCPTRG